MRPTNVASWRSRGVVSTSAPPSEQSALIVQLRAAAAHLHASWAFAELTTMRDAEIDAIAPPPVWPRIMHLLLPDVPALRKTLPFMRDIAIYEDLVLLLGDLMLRLCTGEHQCARGSTFDEALTLMDRFARMRLPRLDHVSRCHLFARPLRLTAKNDGCCVAHAATLSKLLALLRTLAQLVPTGKATLCTDDVVTAVMDVACAHERRVGAAARRSALVLTQELVTSQPNVERFMADGRLVPLLVAELADYRGADALLRLCILRHCISNAPPAAVGVLCGCVPAVEAVLDVVHQTPLENTTKKNDADSEALRLLLAVEKRGLWHPTVERVLMVGVFAAQRLDVTWITVADWFAQAIGRFAIAKCPSGVKAVAEALAARYTAETATRSYVACHIDGYDGCAAVVRCIRALVRACGGDADFVWNAVVQPCSLVLLAVCAGEGCADAVAECVFATLAPGVADEERARRIACHRDNGMGRVLSACAAGCDATSPTGKLLQLFQEAEPASAVQLD